MQEITEGFLQVFAGDIEKLLLEYRETMAWAYKKIPDGIKISISITLDPSSNGIVVSYDMGFDLEPKPDPPEKHKVKYKHVIDESKASFDYLAKKINDGTMALSFPDGRRISNIKD